MSGGQEMINKITINRFKMFKNREINLMPENVTLLVGPNNGGKSTLLQSLALWEFCKSVVKFDKGGSDAFLQSNISQAAKKVGVGLSYEEFHPISIPSLKHLWTNLNPNQDKGAGDKDGYTLKIRCDWVNAIQQNFYLEFGLSLANDRLFVKPLGSNLQSGEDIPVVAYLPPFSGIKDHESPLTRPERKRLIGQGLAGSVLRNLLMDLSGARLPAGANNPREKDWAKLNEILAAIFQKNIEVEKFDDENHTYIKVNSYSLDITRSQLKKVAKSTKDIMVEGSGFLQWLSVFAFALDPDVNVLLLDEPDAHLHAQLQKELVRNLNKIIEDKGKQVLMVSHSTELIKLVEARRILHLTSSTADYLQNDEDKVVVISGLGADYYPGFINLQKHRKLLLVEGTSDEDFLKIWAETLGYVWPSNLTVWQWSSAEKERKALIKTLKKMFPDIKLISLVDKDTDHVNTTCPKLFFETTRVVPEIEGKSVVYQLKWRRTNIENYLIWPPAIARALNKPVEEIQKFLKETHSLSIGLNFKNSDTTQTLHDVDGKKIISEGFTSQAVPIQSVRSHYKISDKGFKFDIARKMAKDEICDDIATLLKIITAL